MANTIYRLDPASDSNNGSDTKLLRGLRVLNLALLIPLSVSTGAVKLAGMPVEVELFAKIGITGAQFIAFGLIQIVAGVLLCAPKTRKLGASMLIPTFIVATAALFVSHVQPFGGLSILFVAMAALAFRSPASRQVADAANDAAATTPADGRAVRTKSTFQMSYSVRANIQAAPDRIWALLTTAADFPRWNSTVTSIKGNIALAEKIALVATIAPSRTFKLTVKEFVPSTKMVWGDGMAPMFQGTRTFTLTRKPDGSTDFSMVEVFNGVMLPMIAGSLPDFAPSFEQYAADLKREAERTA